MKRLLVLDLLLAMLAICSVAFADTVAVGTGTDYTYELPIQGVANYSYSQQIYTQEQINRAGNITKIRFYCIAGNFSNSKDWVIYMGHTSKTNFVSNTDWEPVTNLTQVFAGDVSSLFLLENNWVEITLSTPFAYNNTDNLIIAIDENTYGYSYISWGCFTSGANTGMQYDSSSYTNSINPDPAAPPTATWRTADINRIQFVFPNTTIPLAPTLLGPANDGYALLEDKLYWCTTANGGDADSYDVYFGTSDPPPMVSDNQFGTIYSPTLVPDITYYWYVTATNAFGESVATATQSFRTPGANQLLQSFESDTFPPVGWARISPSTSFWINSTAQHKNGVGSMVVRCSTTDTYSISTPKLSIVNGSTLNFWMRALLSTIKLQILYSADRENWTQLGADITTTSVSNWCNIEVDLSALAGSNYFLAFNSPIQTTDNNPIFVDLVIGPDIAPEAPGITSLNLPADLATNVSEAPTFSWNAPTTGGIPNGYRLYVDINNPPAIMVEDQAATEFTPNTALAYSTTYYWTVEAYNTTGVGPQAPVQSFTTLADPFPWTENFDSVTAPELPDGWRQVGSIGSVQTQATDSQSGPNCIYLNTSFATLALPPVSTSIEKALRLSFWGKSNGLGNSLCIGYLTDPNDAASFTLIDIVGLGTYDYEQFTVNLGAVTGVKHFAIQAGPFFYGILLDNFLIEALPPIPIFSYAPTSLDYGAVSQNTPILQYVTASNLGGGRIDIYASGLNLSGTDAAMFSVDTSAFPVSLAFMETVEIPVLLYATTSGTLSATLNITLRANGITYPVALSATSIFEATVTEGNPWLENFDAQTTSDLPEGWTLIGSAIAPWTIDSGLGCFSEPNAAVVVCYPDLPKDEWMITPPIYLEEGQTYFIGFSVKAPCFYGYSEALALHFGTEPSEAAMEANPPIYDDNNLFQADWAEIIRPFTPACNGAYYFGWHAYSSEYADYIMVDDVTIYIPPAVDLAVTDLTADSFAIVGDPLTLSATVYNTGLNTINSYTVSLKSRDSRETLTQITVNTEIASCNTAVHELSWVPTSSGDINFYAEVYVAEDANPNNNCSSDLHVTAYPSSTNSLYVGDPETTDESQCYPFNLYYENFVAETIYRASEIQASSGTIVALVYQNDFDTSISRPIQIWLQNTTSENCNEGWLPFTGYSLVFDGEVSFPAGLNSILIPITPFNYTGGNLAIRTSRTWLDEWTDSKYFLVTEDLRSEE
ncbi:MAG: choice-of-anchor J domain-containing protein, partial [Candidatus Cloacimonas sp.]|nr:choice-of-anchor J domain-containing protein [Candidatus Cloacimonas sp.]